jgi:hypothetical protein
MWTAQRWSTVENCRENNSSWSSRLNVYSMVYRVLLHRYRRDVKATSIAGGSGSSEVLCVGALELRIAGPRGSLQMGSQDFSQRLRAGTRTIEVCCDGEAGDARLLWVISLGAAGQSETQPWLTSSWRSWCSSLLSASCSSEPTSSPPSRTKHFRPITS